MVMVSGMLFPYVTLVVIMGLAPQGLRLAVGGGVVPTASSVKGVVADYLAAIERSREIVRDQPSLDVRTLSHTITSDRPGTKSRFGPVSPIST
jgi:hypothetical protein